MWVITPASIMPSFSAAARGLSEIERVCFVLKHLEQWRLQEIADELNVKVDAVKQALFRACRKLRTTMGDLRSTANE